MTLSQARSRLWITDPEAYRRRLEALLGDRDPLAVMAQTADTLARIVEAHPAELMRSRPRPGRWTANEVIGHLVDSECVYGYRVRLILCEDRPAVFGTDQELWVARQQHNDREPRELAETFRVLRQLNLAVWRRMGPEELAREGRHNERGPESLERLLRMIPGHDLSHIDQIHRCLDEAREAG